MVPRAIHEVTDADEDDAQNEDTVTSPKAEMGNLTAEQKALLIARVTNEHEDLADAWAGLPAPTSPSAVVLEVGGPLKSNLEGELRKLDVRVDNASNLGFNISSKKDLSRLVTYVKDTRPPWVWFSLPCEDKGERREPEEEQSRRVQQRRRRIRDGIRAALDMAKIQVENGRQFVWEWPRTSTGWKNLEVQDFLRELRQSGKIHRALVDACHFHVREGSDSLWSPRKWCVWTTGASLAQCLQGQCRGEHGHAKLTSPETKLPGGFPGGACRVAGLEIGRQRERDVCMAGDSVMAVEIPEYTDPEKMNAEERGMHAQVMKLHRRSGHPSNASLTALLRARGVDERLVTMAKNLCCDECAQMKITASHLPIGLSREETPWRTLQMDHCDIRWGDVVSHVLVLVDEWWSRRSSSGPRTKAATAQRRRSCAMWKRNR